jgi:hypothetical protein
MLIYVTSIIDVKNIVRRLEAANAKYRLPDRAADVLPE